MKISNNSELQEAIKTLININNININVADMLNLAFSYTDLMSKDEMYKYIKEGYSEKEAIVDMLYDFYKIDRDNSENNDIMNEYFLNNMKWLSREPFLNDLYVKTIKDAVWKIRFKIHQL